MITAIPTGRAASSRNDAPSEPERHDVVVIGGGQAGLATGYHLARRGLDFVILDAHQRVGDAWRHRWDSLTLFTPARYTSLPGMKFPAPRHHFPTKDEVADYLETYAATMELPVRLETKVHRVRRNGDGGWMVEAGDTALAANSIVIATGGYQSPNVPEWAAELDPDIFQIHAIAYRNPSQLQPGPVLVAGASHSGAEIAIEAAREHPTVLAGRDTGQVPIDTHGKLAPIVDPVIWFAVNRVLTDATPMGRQAKKKLLTHGFPLEHPRRSDIAAAGVERVTERAVGARNGKPVLAGGRVLDVRNVVWCTGFTWDYSWIDGLARGDDGYPEQVRGVVPGAPGLYFVGLKFQRAAASSLVGGVGPDARYISERIAERVGQLA